MKIEVGMYVRTEKGIAKYLGLGIDILKDDGSSSYNHWKSKHLFDNYIFEEEYGDTLTTLENIDKIIIGKPSYNIIDLIEVGDVIGYEIKTSLETSGVLKGITNISDEEMLEDIKNNNDYVIKSIVTHKQFESIKYEV